MSYIAITGGGRGIGLELARQLEQLPTSRVAKVIVTTRGAPSAELAKLIANSAGRIVNIGCEVTNEASVQKAAAEIEAQLDGKGLDILINNVGAMPYGAEGVRAMDGETLLQTFDVNVISAHRVTAALIPALQKSKEKKIIMVSSPLGSVGQANRFTWLPTPEYKITKAAMNMLSVQYAIAYEKEGFTVLAISPGWLKTDMGSERADLDVEQGVNAVKDLVLAADAKMNGKFYNIRVPGWEHAEGSNQYDGGEIPW
ncbi:short chain dehydrogenase [Hirsutella rhossiliensis]|uniref:Short chain dehydrogenase domain-containing protein n=1 Tax=Hirsutella rhossiliensis TaxID=111463 RepID=A0A9P8MUQ9_9HYPO|nr:short chain dehydrogenase domain-containing protein [Hirsutella rhossiliensis]KAH0959562.1 short chain dehydrogenase domain-containing protein [Hirsutella rhossiliensis]